MSCEGSNVEIMPIFPRGKGQISPYYENFCMYVMCLYLINVKLTVKVIWRWGYSLIRQTVEKLGMEAAIPGLQGITPQRLQKYCGSKLLDIKPI